MVKSRIVPSVTLVSKLKDVNWELMEEILVFSLNLFPLASSPETKAGKDSWKLFSFFLSVNVRFDVLKR